MRHIKFREYISPWLNLSQNALSEKHKGISLKGFQIPASRMGITIFILKKQKSETFPNCNMSDFETLFFYNSFIVGWGMHVPCMKVKR